MNIPNTSIKRRPTHPGEMLREEFLPEYGLTVSGLAEAVGVSRQSINELLRERRAVSPEMALRLSRLFGNSPELWLNAQRAGVVIYVHEGGQAFEVELVALDGETIAVVTLKSSHIRPVEHGEIVHARHVV